MGVFLQVYYTEKDEWKRIIINESYTTESKSESAHKIVNKEKDAKNEADQEEPTVTDDPVIKEPSYYKKFERGSNILNKLDAMYERACMANPRNK